MCVGLSHVAVTSTSDLAPVWSKKLFDIQAAIVYEFTLKGISDMTKT